MRNNKKNSAKELTLEVKWPKHSINRVKTLKLADVSIKTALSKITRGILNDHCPEGINCMGKPMIDAVSKVLNTIFAARVGNTGSTGYKSDEISDNKQHKNKLKLDDNMFKMEEEDKENGSDDEQLNSSKNVKSKLKLNNSIFKLKDKEDNQFGSDDKQIHKINMDTYKVKLHNNTFKPEDKENRNKHDKTKNQYDKETNKYDYGNITQMEIQHPNPIESFNAANKNDDEMEQNIEKKGPTTNGVDYSLFGSNTIVLR